MVQFGACIAVWRRASVHLLSIHLLLREVSHGMRKEKRVVVIVGKWFITVLSKGGWASISLLYIFIDISSLKEAESPYVALVSVFFMLSFRRYRRLGWLIYFLVGCFVESSFIDSWNPVDRTSLSILRASAISNNSFLDVTVNISLVF